MTPVPRYDLDAWRRQIPVLGKTIPMNNCSQAPQIQRTIDAVQEFMDSWANDVMDWDRWVKEVERARGEFARLINADPMDVAVATSVSQAAASVATALDFDSARNRVVLTEGAFPTVGHVWLAQERRGAQLAWAPVREGMILPEDVIATISEQTALVSVSHGYYQTGYKQELPPIVEAAHSAGSLLFVDAYQTMGTCPIDVRELGVDFLASGNLKFLMGLPGIAFLYVRREVADSLSPLLAGWFGQANPFAFDPQHLEWAKGARRFDTGTPPVLNAYVARAGMEVINEVGPQAIMEWTEVLSARLIEGGLERGLEPLGTREPARKTPTTAFACSNPHRVEEEMRTRGVIPSARGTAIRLAPHFYTTLEEVDRSLDVLAEVVRGH